MFNFIKSRIIWSLLAGVTIVGVLTAQEVRVNGTIQVRIRPEVPGRDSFSFTPPPGYEFVPNSGTTLLGSASLTLEEKVNTSGEYAVDIVIDNGFTGQYNAVCNGRLRSTVRSGTRRPPELWWKAEISDEGGLRMEPPFAVITWTDTTREGPLSARFSVNGLDGDGVTWSGPQDGWKWSPEDRRGNTVELTPTDVGRGALGTHVIAATDSGSGQSANASLYVIDVDLIIADSREHGDDNNPDNEQTPGVIILEGQYYSVRMAINDYGLSDLAGGPVVELAPGSIPLYVPGSEGAYVPYEGPLSWPVAQIPDNLYVTGAKGGAGAVVLKYTAPNGEVFTDTVNLLVAGITLTAGPQGICKRNSSTLSARSIPAGRELSWEMRDPQNTGAQLQKISDTVATVKAANKAGTVTVIVTDKDDPAISAAVAVDIIEVAMIGVMPLNTGVGDTVDFRAKVVPDTRTLRWEFDGDSLDCMFETDEDLQTEAFGTSVRVRASQKVGQVWVRVSDSENSCAFARRRFNITSPCAALEGGKTFDLGVTSVTLGEGTTVVAGPDSDGFCTHEVSKASFSFGIPHPAANLKLPERRIEFLGGKGFKLTFKYKAPVEDDPDSVEDYHDFGIAFHPDSADDYLSINDKFGPISVKIARLALTVQRSDSEQAFQLGGEVIFSVFLKKDQHFGKNLILRRKLMPQVGSQEQLLKGSVSVSLKNLLNLKDFDANRISWDFSGIQNIQIDLVKSAYDQGEDRKGPPKQATIIMIRGSFTRDAILCVNANTQANSPPWKTNAFKAVLCEGSQVSCLYDLATGKFRFYSGTLIIEVSEIENVTGTIRFKGSFNEGEQLPCDEDPLPNIDESEKNWVFKAELESSGKLEVFGFSVVPADGENVASLEVELSSDFEISRIEAKNILAERNDMLEKNGTSAVKMNLSELVVANGELLSFVLAESELKYKRFEMRFVEAVYRKNNPGGGRGAAAMTIAPERLGFQMVQARPPQLWNRRNAGTLFNQDSQEEEPRDVTCEACRCNYPADFERPEPPEGALLRVTGFIGFTFGQKDGAVKVAFKDYMIDANGKVSVGEIAATFAAPPFDVCFKAQFGETGFQGCFDGKFSGAIHVKGSILIGTMSNYSYGKLTLDVNLGIGFPLIFPPAVDTGLNLDRLIGAFGWNVETIALETATLQNPARVEPRKGHFYAGLGLGIRDRANLCRFSCFAAIILGSDSTMVQLLMEMQVTAKKKYLVAGANVSYKLWDDSISGNVSARLTIPEDGSMLNMKGLAAYQYSPEKWSIQKLDGHKHALKGSLFKDVATIVGDIEMHGSNRNSGIGPRGKITGSIVMDKEIIIAHPKGFSPYVKRGDYCEDKKRTCVQTGSVTHCNSCAVETMGRSSFGFVIKDNLKLTSDLELFITESNVSGKMTVSASYNPLVSYWSGKELKAATGELKIKDAEISFNQGVFRLRGAATLNVSFMRAKEIAIDISFKI